MFRDFGALSPFPSLLPRSVSQTHLLIDRTPFKVYTSCVTKDSMTGKPPQVSLFQQSETMVEVGRGREERQGRWWRIDNFEQLYVKESRVREFWCMRVRELCVKELFVRKLWNSCLIVLRMWKIVCASSVHSCSVKDKQSMKLGNQSKFNNFLHGQVVRLIRSLHSFLRGGYATPATQNAAAPLATTPDQARHQTQRSAPRLPRKEKLYVKKCPACHAKAPWMPLKLCVKDCVCVPSE